MYHGPGLCAVLFGCILQRDGAFLLRSVCGSRFLRLRSGFPLRKNGCCGVRFCLYGGLCWLLRWFFRPDLGFFRRVFRGAGTLCSLHQAAVFLRIQPVRADPLRPGRGEFAGANLFRIQLVCHPLAVPAGGDQLLLCSREFFPCRLLCQGRADGLDVAGLTQL